MKTVATFAGLTGYAMAQAAYGGASSITSAAASTTTYACNPAHQYPEGRVCTEISGSLTLLPPTTSSAAAATTTYACNPAHQYPEGRVCTEISGSLTLLPPTTSAAPTYACNPAHDYGNGASCISTAGTLSLVYPSASTTAAATYACNPAHDYGNGASCISTAGTLSLVYPSASTTAAPTYACNPAHDYGNGASCISTAGTLSLVYPSASKSSSASSNECACYASYNVCRGKPDSNKASCASDFASCLGFNPFDSTGSNTVAPKCQSSTAPAPTTTAAPTYACNPAHDYGNGASCISTAGTLSLVYPSASASATKGSAVDCYSAYNTCRGAPDSNKASCAAQYAQCLGYNPFASNGTNTVTPAVSGGGDATVTAVVTAYTTYCPAPTTLTINSKTYTVTKATTLTITDCPCTIQTPVKSMPPASTVTAIVSSFTTVCPSPTTLTVNSKTYTVTKATTLTITDCNGGCTITTPVSALPPPAATTPVVPSGSPSVGVPAYHSSGTGASASSAYHPSGTGASATRSAYPSNSLTPYTGGAQKTVASSAGFFAAFAAMLFL